MSLLIIVLSLLWFCLGYVVGYTVAEERRIAKMIEEKDQHNDR